MFNYDFRPYETVIIGLYILIILVHTVGSSNAVLLDSAELGLLCFCLIWKERSRLRHKLSMPIKQDKSTDSRYLAIKDIKA